MGSEADVVGSSTGGEVYEEDEMASPCQTLMPDKEDYYGLPFYSVQDQ